MLSLDEVLNVGEGPGLLGLRVGRIAVEQLTQARRGHGELFHQRPYSSRTPRNPSTPGSRGSPALTRGQDGATLTHSAGRDTDEVSRLALFLRGQTVSTTVVFGR